MKILLTGGLGYIGSHTAAALMEIGHDIEIIDNLSNSSVDVVENLKKINKSFNPIVHIGDITDTSEHSLFDVLMQSDISTIIHFAALKSVKESVEKPEIYYFNNILGTINLLNKMVKYGKKRLVFSSSCTVYGKPETYPVTELTPLKEPENPYGKTKRICEDIIIEYAKNCGIEVVILRYFNPIGAHPSGMLFENPNGIPENLMPYVMGVINNKYSHVNIYGGDYDTNDGTAIRDYIDINDLADAHVKSIDIVGKEPVQIINLGTGNGISVMDIINSFRDIGVDVPYKIVDRRAGDVDKIFADISKSRHVLGWEPKVKLSESLSSLLALKHLD